MKNYICYECRKTFNPKKRYQIFCSDKCRKKSFSKTQKCKITKHRHYINKVKPTLVLKYKFTIAGTIFDSQLQKRIDTLKCIYEQQLKHKLENI